MILSFSTYYILYFSFILLIIVLWYFIRRKTGEKNAFRWLISIICLTLIVSSYFISERYITRIYIIDVTSSGKIYTEEKCHIGTVTVNIPSLNPVMIKSKAGSIHVINKTRHIFYIREVIIGPKEYKESELYWSKFESVVIHPFSIQEAPIEKIHYYTDDMLPSKMNTRNPSTVKHRYQLLQEDLE